MDRELRDAVAWGLVGGLSFLVLALGYRLLTPATPDAAVLAGVAVVVTALATGASYGLDRWLSVNESP